PQPAPGNPPPGHGGVQPAAHGGVQQAGYAGSPQPGAPQPAWGGPPAAAPAYGGPQQHGYEAPQPAAPAYEGSAHGQRAPPAVPRAAEDPERVAESAPRVLAGFLVSYQDNELGRFYPLYQGRNVIGRRDSGLELDIPIEHATTSSRHAVVFAPARPARLKLEDQGSTNGTFVNEERLPTGERRELCDGDAVRFGGYSVIAKII